MGCLLRDVFICRRMDGVLCATSPARRERRAGAEGFAPPVNNTSPAHDKICAEFLVCLEP